MYFNKNLFDTSRIFWQCDGMSIELQFKKGSLALRVLLKDEALSALQKVVADYQSDEELPPMSAQIVTVPTISTPLTTPAPAADSVAVAKEWLGRHSASEAINLIAWKTNPEKILILGAFHEAKGGGEGWRSADMQTRFSESRDGFPANFPRDISSAIKDNLIAPVTARTYKVGRIGWNKLAEAVASLSHA